jgi:putative ABC transport system permease protein
MTAFALRGMLGRKLRTVLTAVAIVLGVALVCGTYVLTDSISGAFDSIFASTYRNTDAVITGKSAFKLSGNNNQTDPSFDESLLQKVKSLPDVSAALGGVQGDAHLIGENGKAIVFGGAPNIGFSVDPTQPRFNSLTLYKGAWPGPGEVIVDKSTAGKKDLRVGQTIGVQSRGPVVRLRISGIAKYGAVSSIGGATLAGFDLATAQRLFDKEGKLDQIRIAKKPGVTQQRLLAEVRSILPPGTQARSGDDQASKDAEDVNSFLSFLQKFLLAFGGVALFVGAFVIFNSLSITIAQRTREFATLRTLGASRRQIIRSVVIEALVTGVLASVIGLFLGVGIAKGLFELFQAVGFTLPNNGLPLEFRTILVSLGVGILVTLLASLYPALRATTVPPIAAVREGAVLPGEPLDAIRGVNAAVATTGAGIALTILAAVVRPGGTIPAVIIAVVALVLTMFGSALFPSRGFGAILSIGLGLGAILYGLFGQSLGTTQVLIWIGIGVFLIFFGVARVATVTVPRLTGVMSPVARWTVFVFTLVIWPNWSLPFWLLRRGMWGPGGVFARVSAVVAGAVLNPLLFLIVLGMSARKAITAWHPEWPAPFPGVLIERSSVRLGTENSERNPQRTASTAAALMIGLALVALVATLSVGIIKPFTDAVDQLFTSDYAITAQNNFDPIPPSAARAAARTPGVEAIASVRAGDGAVVGPGGHTKVVQVTGVQPETSQVISIKWQSGSSTVIDHLGATGTVVSKGYAKDHDLHVGSRVVLASPKGDFLHLAVKGIFAPPTGGSPFGNYTISSEAFDAHWQQPQNLFTFIKMRGGVTDANTKALENAIRSFPNAKAQTRQQFKDNQISGFKQILNVLYLLLALSVVISLFGIVNTLILTVFERTRELGMLRAIGMNRRQVRRMIRHESVITALIGAVLGLVLGVVLGALLAVRVKEIVFAVPWLQLVIFTVAAIVVGIVAAIFPARRAARLSPLDALHYE